MAATPSFSKFPLRQSFFGIAPVMKTNLPVKIISEKLFYFLIVSIGQLSSREDLVYYKLCFKSYPFRGSYPHNAFITVTSLLANIDRGLDEPNVYAVYKQFQIRFIYAIIWIKYFIIKNKERVAR